MALALIAACIWMCLFSYSCPFGTVVSNIKITSEAPDFPEIDEPLGSPLTSFRCIIEQAEDLLARFGSWTSEILSSTHLIEGTVKPDLKELSISEWLTNQFDDVMTGLRNVSPKGFSSVFSINSHIKAPPEKTSTSEVIKDYADVLLHKLEVVTSRTFPLIAGDTQEIVHINDGSANGSEVIREHFKKILKDIGTFTSPDTLLRICRIAITRDTASIKSIKVVVEPLCRMVLQNGLRLLVILSSLLTLILLLRNKRIERQRNEFMMKIEQDNNRRREEFKKLLSQCNVVKYEKRQKTKRLITPRPLLTNMTKIPKPLHTNMIVTDIIPRFTTEYLEKVSKLRHYQMGACILPSRLILGLAAMPADTKMEVKEKAILQQYNVYKMRKSTKWINDLRNLSVGTTSRDWIDSNILAI